MSGPSAAVRYAASTSSRVTSRATVVLSSTIEPTGIGTRIESPDSLPSRFGSTWPIALAAPVVVGTMLTPHGAGAARVAVRTVLEVLLLRVGVHRRHEAVLDAA